MINLFKFSQKHGSKAAEETDVKSGFPVDGHSYINDICELLFEKSPIGIMILNMKGFIRYCNPASYTHGGYTREDFIGRHYTDLATITDCNIPGIYDLFKTINSDQAPSPFECSFQRRDGTTGYMEIHTSLLKLDDDKSGIILFIKNITERKRAEEALKESEEKFSKVFRSSPNLIIITRIRDNVILDINDGTTQINGYTREEVVGQTAADLNFWESSQERDRVINTLRERGSFNNEELNFITKSGEVRTGLVSAEICNISGEPCVIFVATDITERQRAEEALRESEEKYRDLLDNTEELFQSVTPDGQFKYVNKAWLKTLGYNRDDIARLNLLDIIHPDYRNHCQEIFGKLISGENIDLFTTSLVSKSGDEIIVEGNANCKFVDGQPVHTRGIFRNITKKVRMEEQMQRLSSALAMSEDCIFITDADARILDVNEKTLEFYNAESKDELVGRHFLELIVPEERAMVNMDVGQIIKDGNLECREYNIITKSGSTLPMQITTSLVKDAAGKPMGMIRVGRKVG